MEDGKKRRDLQWLITHANHDWESKSSLLKSTLGAPLVTEHKQIPTKAKYYGTFLEHSSSLTHDESVHS